MPLLQTHKSRTGELGCLPYIEIALQLRSPQKRTGVSLGAEVAPPDCLGSGSKAEREMLVCHCVVRRRIARYIRHASSLAEQAGCGGPQRLSQTIE